MTFRLLFRPQAERELAEANTWYQDRQVGLESKFRADVEGVPARIVANPLIYPLLHDEIRRATLRQFPDAVFLSCKAG